MDMLIVFSEVNVSWGMALVDFIPVVLFCSGVGFILKFAHKRLNAFWFSLLSGGAFLGFFGGLSKCTWKLLYAAGIDFLPFNISFAVYQTIGFLLIALGLIALVIGDKKRQVNKTIVLSSSLLVFLPIVLAEVRVIGKPGFLWYIMMGLFTTTYLACLGILAVRRKMWIELGCLVVSLICMWAMAMLKSKFESGGSFEKMNWIAQVVNIITQLAMAYPAVRLYKKLSVEPLLKEE